MNLALIVSIIESIAQIALKGSSARRAGEALAIFRTLLEAGEEGLEELKRFAAEVKDLADTGQAPSDDQWNSFRERDRSARTQLEENRRRLEESADPAIVSTEDPRIDEILENPPEPPQE